MGKKIPKNVSPSLVKTGNISKIGGNSVDAEVYLFSNNAPYVGGAKAPAFLGKFSKDEKRADKFVSPWLIEPDGWAVIIKSHGEKIVLEKGDFHLAKGKNKWVAISGALFKSGIFATVEVSRGVGFFKNTFAINAFVTFNQSAESETNPAA